MSADGDQSARPAEGPIQDRLRALLRPDRVIETHAAWVFLAGDRAYKLKKALRTRNFDHLRPTSRRRACLAELRLNHDLAPGIYRDVAPVTRAAGGKVEIGGPGPVIDWLLVMTRLPEDRMLDTWLECQKIPPPEALCPVFDRLAAFYAAHPIGPADYLVPIDQIRQTAEIDAVHLDRWKDLLGPGLGDLCGTAMDRLAAAIPEMADRAARGQFADGHGDLRPEHICLSDPPVVFDRIDFSRRLRLIDVYDEAGYLGMECRLLGHAGIGRLFSDRLTAAGFEPPSPGLAQTYLMLRALTRARLSIDHLLDVEPRTPKKWPRQARAYLAVARRVATGGR